MARKFGERMAASSGTTPFQARVLQHLRAEGLVIRQILRVYPPYDIGDLHEVLFVSTDKLAGTCWVDATGKLQVGPVSGFGPRS